MKNKVLKYVIVFVVIVAIAFLIYHFYKGEEEADNSEQNITQEEQTNESATLRIRYI